MICHSFPGLTDDGMTATYQRSHAMIREDMHFLTWEHPMVSGATDMILSGDFGNTAFCNLKTPSLKPGTLLLEAIFIVHCPAPKKLQLHQYLPLTTIRIVVDSLDRDLSEALPVSKLNRMAERVPLRSVQELIKHARPQISELVIAAEKRAAPERAGLIGTALQHMSQMQDAEIQRLQALAEVNPTIRKDEIEFMRTSSEQLQNFLQGATLKLDAIRVAMAT
jgi:ATP-dependent helicase HepA